MEKKKIGRYTVEETRWLDEDSFVASTDTFTDKDGDDYHLDVEWHKDEGWNEDAIHFISVYEYDTAMGDEFECLNLTHGYLTDEERTGFKAFIGEIMEKEKEEC